MLELGQIVAGWPLGASMAAAVAARGLQAGRRRMALNEALHELRRPLQALALAVPGTAQRHTQVGVEGSVQLAAVALERLEREINGEPKTSIRMAVPALAGGALELCWRGGDAAIECDRCLIAQALDNLIVNAIEHGGPEILVEARISRRRLAISVVDSGPPFRLPARCARSEGRFARLSGRHRRGHGLRVVRRTAAEHGGEFRLRRTGRGTEASLELPLVGADRGKKE
jgi:signal transduction histidine kinase